MNIAQKMAEANLEAFAGLYHYLRLLKQSRPRDLTLIILIEVLLLCLEQPPPPVNDTNPYNVFRPREKAHRLHTRRVCSYRDTFLYINSIRERKPLISFDSATIDAKERKQCAVV